MQFVVRYWSSILPKEFRKADGSMRLLDYSIHPPTRLGLHNAMLARNDRVEILEMHGGTYECEVYVAEGESAYVLTQVLAIKLFNTLPTGEVKWISIREFMLPFNNTVQADNSALASVVSHDRQLHLFEYSHAADEHTSSHQLDMDA